MNRYDKLVENYKSKRPRRGDLLVGEILHVDEDAILVDVGSKRDAVVPSKELSKLNQDQLEDLNVGDEIPVFVLHTPAFGEELQVSIQKGMRQKDWVRAQELLKSSETVELEVIGQNHGGAIVSFGQLRGFVPNTHIPGLRKNVYDSLGDIKINLIGTTIPLKVIEADVYSRKLILSGRETGSELRRRRLQKLEIGETVEGRVVHIVDFGAFIDLGGVDGLLHISELDWGKVEHPSDVVQIGERIKVYVLDVDMERERISLSRKELLDSPWDTISEKYSVGDHVEGEVTNVTNFGAFVSLPDGIIGLLHESEMGIDGPFYPEDVIKTGERVIVRIVAIEPTKGRMSLSLRFLQGEETSSKSNEDGDSLAEGLHRFINRYGNW